MVILSQLHWETRETIAGTRTGNRMVHGAKPQIQQRDGNTVIFKSVVNIKHANFHECFGFFMQKTVCFLFKTQWSKGKQQQLYFFIATKYLGVLLWNCFEFRLFFKFGYFYLKKKYLKDTKKWIFFPKKWRPRDITLTIRRKVNTIHEVGRGLSFRRKIQLV